jgi:hypothetical protein
MEPASSNSLWANGREMKGNPPTIDRSIRYLCAYLHADSIVVTIDTLPLTFSFGLLAAGLA